MPSRRWTLTLVACLALGWASGAAAQEPTEEEMLQLLEALQDTVEALDEAPAPRDTLGGVIPAADPLYNQLLEGAAEDTLEAGQGPILYRGQRLVFYPESEVIVLE